MTEKNAKTNQPNGNLNTIEQLNEEELDNTLPETVDENLEDSSLEEEEENGSEQFPELVAVFEEVHLPQRAAHRECVVCLQLINHYQASIQPCPCEYWVHTYCLVSGLRTYEALHPACAPLGCKFCMTRFNISPKKDLAFQVLDKVSFRYGQLCNFGYRGIYLVFVDSTFTVVGFSILRKIYGHREAGEMLFSMNPIKAVAMCKAIPVISIAINYIPWETKLLKFLRRCSALPVVGSAFPSADPRVREVKYRRTLFGVLTAGLLMPYYADFFGVQLFGAVTSRLHRFLLGGVAFLALKGALQMYYRQRLYARQCFLTVEGYRED